MCASKGKGKKGELKVGCCVILASVLLMLLLRTLDDLYNLSGRLVYIVIDAAKHHPLHHEHRTRQQLVSVAGFSRYLLGDPPPML